MSTEQPDDRALEDRAVPAPGLSILVIVRTHHDWPDVSFELKVGVALADTLNGWCASMGIKGELKRRLAYLIQAGHVQVLDIASNPPTDASKAAVAQLEQWLYP